MREDPWKPLHWLSGVVIVGTMAVLCFAPEFIRTVYGRHGLRTLMGPVFGYSMMLLMLAALTGWYALERSLGRSLTYRKKQQWDVSRPNPEAIRLIAEGMLRSARRGTLSVTEIDEEPDWGEPDRAAAFTTAKAAMDRLPQDQLGVLKLGNELAVRMGRTRLLTLTSWAGLFLAGVAVAQLPVICLPFPIGISITLGIILLLGVFSYWTGNDLTSNRTKRRPYMADRFLTNCLDDPGVYLEALAAMSAVERTEFPRPGRNRSAREYTRRLRRLEQALRVKRER